MDNPPTYTELVDALELMALQYLERDGVIDHGHMSAGEHCVDCLERIGKVRDMEFTNESEWYTDLAPAKAPKFDNFGRVIWVPA